MVAFFAFGPVESPPDQAMIWRPESEDRFLPRVLTGSASRKTMAGSCENRLGFSFPKHKFLSTLRLYYERIIIGKIVRRIASQASGGFWDDERLTSNRINSR